VRRLLVFRGFAHDAQGVLTTVYQPALVVIEHALDFTLRQSKDVVLRLERPITVFADGCHRVVESHYAQIPLRHGYSLAHGQGGRNACGNQTAPLPNKARVTVVYQFELGGLVRCSRAL
jgi:hypothetical protein